MDVVADFAARMGNERRLIALYLLTVADIRGTSPKVWNAWESSLLENLFRAWRGAACAVEITHAGSSLESRKDQVRELLQLR